MDLATNKLSLYKVVLRYGFLLWLFDKLMHLYVFLKMKVILKKQKYLCSITFNQAWKRKLLCCHGKLVEVLKVFL